MWPIRDTYQARYTAVIGTPLTILQVLALTQVFERRVYRHFSEHLHRPETHQLVQDTLCRMLEEEKGHLSWVKQWLDVQARTRAYQVSDTMRRYAEADAIVYAALLDEFGWRHTAPAVELERGDRQSATEDCIRVAMTTQEACTDE